MCGEGPHCLLGTAHLRWCHEPGAQLLNHGQVQACPVPCPQARVITQTEISAFGCSCRISEESWRRLLQSTVHTSKGLI